jgi:hypothetical protein
VDECDDCVARIGPEVRGPASNSPRMPVKVSTRESPSLVLSEEIRCCVGRPSLSKYVVENKQVKTCTLREELSFCNPAPKTPTCAARGC